MTSRTTPKCVNGEEESNNNECVMVEIIEDDKENHDLRNSLSIKNQRPMVKRFSNKNRMTMTDIDSLMVQSSGYYPFVAHKLEEMSSTRSKDRDSVDTCIVHNDESCLTNVFDEYEQAMDDEDETNLAEVLLIKSTGN